jgi:hypothetical protein
MTTKLLETLRLYTFECVMGHRFDRFTPPDAPEGIKCERCDATAAPVSELTDDLEELAQQACECGHLPDVHDEAGCWNCGCQKYASSAEMVIRAMCGSIDFGGHSTLCISTGDDPNCPECGKPVN